MSDNKRIFVMGFLGIISLFLAVNLTLAQEEPVPAAPQPPAQPQAAPAEETKVVVSVPKAEKAFEPYVGKITGERINIRSGPAEPYYPIGFLNKGDKVIVHQEEHGVNNWAQIYPTPQCFSYIAKNFVDLQRVLEGSEPDSLNQTAEVSAPAVAAPVPSEPAVTVVSDTLSDGTKNVDLQSLIGKKTILGAVNADNVRIRAGSLKVPPANADVVQTRLNKGSIVQIIGQRDDYYQIICPPDCFFWIALDYVERVKPITSDVIENYISEAKQSILEEGIPEVEAAPVTVTQAEDKARSTSEQDRQTYREAAEMLRQELEKPIMERNYQEITGNLDKLIETTAYPSIKTTAQMLKRRVEISMMAQDIQRKSQQQDETLKVTMSNINSNMQKLVAEVQPKKAEDLVVQGRIAESSIFTAPNKNRRYLVLDDKDQIIYYAVANAEGLDLAQWVGKNVSMSGPSELDTFSKIRVVNVTSLIELPAK